MKWKCLKTLTKSLSQNQAMSCTFLIFSLKNSIVACQAFKINASKESANLSPAVENIFLKELSNEEKDRFSWVDFLFILKPSFGGLYYFQTEITLENNSILLRLSVMIISFQPYINKNNPISDDFLQDWAGGNGNGSSKKQLTQKTDLNPNLTLVSPNLQIDKNLSPFLAFRDF